MREQSTTFKDVLHAVIHGKKLKPKVLAEELGISYTMLMNAANPEEPDFKLQARLIVPITKRTGDTRLIEYLASACGMVAIKLPEVPGSVSDLHTELAETLKHFGKLVEVTGRSLMDGRVTSDEVLEVEAAWRDVVRHGQMMVAALQDHVND